MSWRNSRDLHCEINVLIDIKRILTGVDGVALTGVDDGVASTGVDGGVLSSYDYIVFSVCAKVYSIKMASYAIL